jgi:hypothetical protein
LKGQTPSIRSTPHTNSFHQFPSTTITSPAFPDAFAKAAESGNWYQLIKGPLPFHWDGSAVLNAPFRPAKLVAELGKVLRKVHLYPQTTTKSPRTQKIGRDRKRGAGLSMLDAEHWRKRAAQMRRIADGLGVLALAKASMLRTAEEYDRLAARAEERLGQK